VHPIILQLGSFKIYSYSLMVLIAFCAGTLYAWLEAKRLKENPEHALDLAVLVFIFSFIGGRLAHCIVNWRIYLADPLRIFKIWEGGLVYYGGYLASALVCYIYIKRSHLNLGRWADILAPTAMTTLFFGRIGCFLNGCCYGSPAPDWFPFKVKYPLSVIPLHLAGVALHPTPIYESLLTGLIALGLILYRKRKKYEGELFWLMMVLYPVVRFFLEYLRADPRGVVPGLNLSTSQFLGILIFIPSLVCLIIGYRRKVRQDALQ